MVGLAALCLVWAGMVLGISFLSRVSEMMLVTKPLLFCDFLMLCRGRPGAHLWAPGLPLMRLKKGRHPAHKWAPGLPLQSITSETRPFFEDLAESVTISPGSIVSRTLRADEHAKLVVFGFDKGQELSEHTASVPAIIHIISGEADLTLGGEKQSAKAGTWAWMPAHLPHSITAKTPVVMLLTMFKGTKGS